MSLNLAVLIATKVHEPKQDSDMWDKKSYELMDVFMNCEYECQKEIEVFTEKVKKDKILERTCINCGKTHHWPENAVNWRR